MNKENFRSISIKDLLALKEISVRTHNCCACHGFESLLDILEYNKQGYSFLNIRNAGRRVCLELENICQKYTDILTNNSLCSKQVDINSLIENDLINAINTKQITPSDVLRYLNENQIFILKNEYELHFSNLSNRTKNRLSKLSFEEYFIEYLFIIDKHSIKKVGLGERSFQELNNLNNILYIDILNIIKLSNDEIEELALLCQDKIFGNKQILEFYKTHKYIPLFWLIEDKLLESKTRAIDILLSTFEIIKDRPLFSLKDYAKKNDITYERVRQIRSIFLCKKNASEKRLCISKVLSKINISSYVDFTHYETKLKNKDIIWQDDDIISDILYTENSHLSNLFVINTITYITNDEFILFTNDCSDIKKAKWKKSFLISKDLCDIFNFDTFLDKFKTFIFNNENEHDIDIKEYIMTSTFWKSHIEIMLLNRINSVIIDILFQEFQLYPNIENLITIPATKEKNISDILYEILKENTQPMILDNIFTEFKRVHSSHRYTDASQLRPYFQKDNRFSYRNRNSTYTLSEWEHIKTGTIRDTIIEFLRKNKDPQKLDKITQYVLSYFPESNSASIKTSMSNDTLKRFVFFENKLFGLRTKEYASNFKEIPINGVKKSFDKRIYEFEVFLSKNNHYPFANSKDENEARLYRWWNSINKDGRKLTQKQLSDIRRIKDYYINYETDKNKYDWLLHSNELKTFLKLNHRLPQFTGDEKFLASWFSRAKRDFMDNKLDDNQILNYIELCKLI